MAGTPKRLLLCLTVGMTLASPAFQATAVTPPLPQPSWRELSENHRRILAPLAGEWDKLESWRRKKWLGIAERYPLMNPEEQQRIQKQMREWVRLPPEQRAQIREQYRQLTQNVSPEQKELLKQKWQQYRELPPEEKRRLQQAARQAPAQRTLPIKPPLVVAPPTPVVVEEAQPLIQSPNPIEGNRPPDEEH